MKKLKWCLLIGFATTIYILSLFARDSMLEKPRLVSVHGDVYNWGIIEEGSKISHDFVLKNMGKSDLLIAAVKSGCGCTNTDLSSKLMKPNETAILKVEYTARRVTSREDISVWIKSNDESQPIKELILTGLVKLRVRCQPTSLSFNLEAKSEQNSQTFHIHANSETAKIANVNAPDSLSLEWDRTSNGYKCHVKPVPENVHSTTNLIAADIDIDGKKHEVQLPVYILH